MKMNLTHISKKSKTIAATAFVLGVAAVGAGTFNASTAFADTTSNRTPEANRTAHITNLVNALAQKFNLNSTEVKTVVDTVMASEKATMQANHDKNLAERLAKAVTAGKITQAQSVLITAKIQETKAFMESMKNKTDAERKTAMTAYKANIEAWATANNIPKEFLNMGGMKQMKGKGHGKFDGERMGKMMGENK
jgi:polyhydroxyalkanoate synthesis regulator phasin